MNDPSVRTPGRECRLPTCPRAVHAKALCNAHYLQQLRGREFSTPRVIGDPERRFQSKVDKHRPAPQHSAHLGQCWVWVGSVVGGGYGEFWYKGAARKAHRVALDMAGTHVPKDLEVDHICFTPSCVRPSHLRLATRSQNLQNRRGANTGNKSGLRGVYQDRGRWTAKSMLEGRSYRHGFFDTAEEASLAASKWRKENMPYSTEAYASLGGAMTSGSTDTRPGARPGATTLRGNA